MKKLLFFIFILFLASCTKSKHHKHNDNISNDTHASNIVSDSDFQVIGEYEAISKENGAIQVTFNISQGTSAFQLITKFDGQEIGVDSVVSPKGETVFNSDVYYSDYQTDGKKYQQNINTFNFPVSTTSSNLEEGTYTVNLRLKSNKSGISGSSILITKADSNKSSGLLTLNVIFMGSIANSQELIKNIKKALDGYSIPTLNKAGIAVNVNYYSYPNLNSVLPNPQVGDSLYESVSGGIPSGVNLFMGSDVSNLRANNGHSGVAASVPGPVIATQKSAISFSLNKAVGNDGEFNGRGRNGTNNTEKDEDEGDEVQLFSDSISHEIFHYLGLRNSVEFSGNTVVWGDGLNSEKCTHQNRCEQIKEARENVMYPYPIRHTASTDDNNYYWYIRNRVSSDQRMVANKWVGVN